MHLSVGIYQKICKPCKNSSQAMKFTVSGANCDNTAQQEGKHETWQNTSVSFNAVDKSLKQPAASKFALFELASSAFIEAASATLSRAVKKCFEKAIIKIAFSLDAELVVPEGSFLYSNYLKY